jgi:hypothetical protein
VAAVLVLQADERREEKITLVSFFSLLSLYAEGNENEWITEV